MTQDYSTGRFAVVGTPDNKWVVQDYDGLCLSFSYDLKLARSGKASFWNNYYSARGFAQKLHKIATNEPCTA